MDLDPQLPKSLTSDPTSFAYTSARTRWPAILTSAIDDVHRTVAGLPFSDDDEDAQHRDKIAEGKAIVSQLASLKYELQHDRRLIAIVDDGDGEGDWGGYNDELNARARDNAQEGGAVKWHDVEWLFSECYMYRRMASIFAATRYWKDYDCFGRQKMGTFRSSRSAVVELAARYAEVVGTLRRGGGVLRRSDTAGGGGGDGSEKERGKERDEEEEEEEEQAEKVLFVEMAEICLWGNATDLSLLTQLTYEDIQKLQGSRARKESESKVLVNELPAAFEVLNSAKKMGKESRRVDIVLDNAGFELFVDLVLAGYLIETGLATEVVLHPKSIPWFVSDVVPKDLLALLEVLRDPRGFYEEDGENNGNGKLKENEVENLMFLFEHWSTLHEEGRLILRPNRFWTHPGSFWRMPRVEPGLLEDLKESELVIFKGDLNYRKLTGDALWDPTTPFDKAIGPLGKASGIRTLTLRTCKADVVVGLPPGKDEEVRATEGGGGDSGARKWAWSGKWALVHFCDGKI